MSDLHTLLAQLREIPLGVRDQGTSFENLIVAYLKNEPMYKEQYKEVLPFAQWFTKYGQGSGIKAGKDTGIDLVAITKDGENHAIQCKNYEATHKIYKSDIDSFFTASGKKCFSQRIIVATTDLWSDNAIDALENQNPPVSRIGLYHLENSVIDWSHFSFDYNTPIRTKKSLRPHQKEAVQAVKQGFQSADRGKMIMACGTGKTFTSLKIAEQMAGKGKRVLFLVPSLALLGQTLTEWTQESLFDLNCFAVCSDSDVGKKHFKEDDRIITGMSDLQYPATTNARSLAKAMHVRQSKEVMTVVFSTYHSIEVLHQAQNDHAFPIGEFDLIICDEAHRTTGATFDGEDESAFVRVHDNDYIKGKKRLYMTATPRIYGEQAKQEESVTLYSMDDESRYGQQFYVLSFSEAVAKGLLVDYKVIVLAVDEAHIQKRLQDLLRDSNNTLQVDDAAKIVGCWKALAKYGLDGKYESQDEPMQRAVAFCQVIEKEYKGKKHKVSSKQIAEMFGAVVKAYQEMESAEFKKKFPGESLPPALSMVCESEHVDGGMNASEKESKLAWLKADMPEKECRILSNVRCLSEGVDVPALDAVLFLTPRSSEVDVVQSVGRVMRLAPGKKMGYVVLPVVIPSGVEPDEALNNNESYRVVWQVLNALRAHDDRFDAMINKIDLVGKVPSKMEVVAVTGNVTRRSTGTGKSSKPAQQGLIGAAETSLNSSNAQLTMDFSVGQVERALYAKIVRKCGNRHHWEDWANDIAAIAQRHIDRINIVLENPANQKEIKLFNEFANELRDDLNNSITDEEIIEMLAQHLITKPVFDALFKDYSFASHNPISKAMQKVLDELEKEHLEKERKTLESFYESVKMRAEGIDNAAGKQRIVVELYDKFFRNAFPRMTERLGIVYTPIEVVDFIIHSVEDLLKSEFNCSIADKGVHILDPFTGTGTFMTRLLQSGLIPLDKLPHKYKHELHANELVLLAYYIAAINIETTYHDLLSGEKDEDGNYVNAVEYEPFEGICLTDTFQMYESEDMVDQLLHDNSDRRKRQKQLDIRVILGNPPYSVGQNSANDNAANFAYPSLDKRIRETYAANTKATLRNALYDSYIRSIRWASDRVGEKGIVGFVTNAGWIDANTADGMRQCLAEEFSSLYVFHLRGNQRTSGERSRKEGGKIFGSGSRAPIAISMLVKNPEKKDKGQIYFHDIGDYLTREEKLSKIAQFASVNGITQAQGWQKIVPDSFNDWLNQRDPNFDKYWELGEKKNQISNLIFAGISLGISSARDSWVYSFSKKSLISNMQRTIHFFNKCVGESISPIISLSDISWSANLVKQFNARQNSRSLNQSYIRTSIYRPFTKSNIYFDRFWLERPSLTTQLFPAESVENYVICTSGRGAANSFSALLTNTISNYDLLSKTRCFPLYLYDNNEDQPDDLLQAQNTSSGYTRRDAITDEALSHFQEPYKQAISKEDIFYYIYGLLHSEEYREKYADNLMKQLPRIPRMKTYEGFKAFSDAGRALADWHLNYESKPLYQGAKLVSKSLDLGITENSIVGGADDKAFYVTKMKFAKKDDKTRVIYNDFITIADIPEEAYEYIVNGKSALEWVMERQGVSTHKDSGITNDANDWAIETMHNPRYPLELFLRIITLSLETQKLVQSLPKLDVLDS